MSSATLTVRLAPELKDRLGTLADSTQRTKSFLASEAIERYVERELEIVASIERGIADMKAGRVTPHSEVMQEADTIIAAARNKDA